jgi:hypothetical protein
MLPVTGSYWHNYFGIYKYHHRHYIVVDTLKEEHSVNEFLL